MWETVPFQRITNALMTGSHDRFAVQVEASGGQLLQRLLGEWGLLRELGIVQGLFLLARPWLDAFAAGLFERLRGGASLADIPPYELTTMAQASLLASCQPGEACPDPEAVSGESRLPFMMRVQVSSSLKRLS